MAKHILLRKWVGKQAPQSGVAAGAVVDARSLAPKKHRRSKHTAVLMMALCLILAIFMVLMVPLLANGASSSQGAVSQAPKAAAPAKTEYQKLSDAERALGFTAVLPADLPDGTEITAIRAVDKSILEIEYQIGKDKLCFRMAPGKEDVSGSSEVYNFTTSEEAGGVVRSYAGVTEEKLSMAVWADGGNSYALVVNGSMDAATLKEIAESVPGGWL